MQKLNISYILHLTHRAKISFSAISSCYANNKYKIKHGRGEREKNPDPFAEGEGERGGGVGWPLTKDADLIVAKRSRFR